MIKIEHNVETGEITEVELTTDELKEIEAAAKTAEALKKANETEALKKATAITALFTKLGLTEAEAKLLLS